MGLKDYKQVSRVRKKDSKPIKEFKNNLKKRDELIKEKEFKKKLKRLAEAYNTYWELKPIIEKEGYIVNGAYAMKVDKEKEDWEL